MRELSAEQARQIKSYVPVFRQYFTSGGRESDLESRRERVRLYAQLLSPEGLSRMSEQEFGQVVSSLWATLLWGNKGYLVDKLLQDNGLPTIVEQLRNLLWGKDPLAIRYDSFRKNIKGLGPSSITEILAFVHPDQCGLWNDKARKALKALGFGASFRALNKHQISGSQYEEFNDLLRLVRDELQRNGIENLDLLGVDYFLFEVWKAEKERGEPASVEAPPSGYEFDHSEAIEQLTAIGQWLGFETEREKTVAKGARVDVVWKARIANLGVVTYVFEVQRRGSLDSLILNLQKAQNNPTVQRLIVVANREDIDRVQHEIATLPESFRRAVGFMEAAEAARAAELLSELSAIVNKLELVRSEFKV